MDIFYVVILLHLNNIKFFVQLQTLSITLYKTFQTKKYYVSLKGNENQSQLGIALYFSFFFS